MSGNIRRLHVIGFSAEQGGFILAERKGAKSGSYLLPLDEELEAHFDESRRGSKAHRSPAPDPAARSIVGSALTPRAIQARLRAGLTVEEVAAEAGVGTDWIERFAGPVQAEQAAAVDRARRAVLHTPRRGPSDRPLADSVVRNLATRGLLMTDESMDEAWSARHVVDSEWVVAFRFPSRGRVATAEWMLNLATGGLTARNRLGGELGFVEPAAQDGRAGAGPTLETVPVPNPSVIRPEEDEPAAPRTKPPRRAEPEPPPGTGTGSPERLFEVERPSPEAGDVRFGSRD
jgi:hypothetical protein